MLAALVEGAALGTALLLTDAGAMCPPPAIGSAPEPNGQKLQADSKIANHEDEPLPAVGLAAN